MFYLPWILLESEVRTLKPSHHGSRGLSVCPLVLWCLSEDDCQADLTSFRRSLAFSYVLFLGLSINCIFTKLHHASDTKQLIHFEVCFQAMYFKYQREQKSKENKKHTVFQSSRNVRGMGIHLKDTKPEFEWWLCIPVPQHDLFTNYL